LKPSKSYIESKTEKQEMEYGTTVRNYVKQKNRMKGNNNGFTCIR